MWRVEHSLDTDLDPETLWATLAAVCSGELRVDGLDEYVTAVPLQVGTPLEVIPEGAERMLATITEFEPPKRLAEQTRVDGLLLTTRYRFTRVAGGTRVTRELVVEGEGADELRPDLGAALGDAFPAQLEVLTRTARRGRGSAVPLRG